MQLHLDWVRTGPIINLAESHDISLSSGGRNNSFMRTSSLFVARKPVSVSGEKKKDLSHGNVH